MSPSVRESSLPIGWSTDSSLGGDRTRRTWSTVTPDQGRDVFVRGYEALVVALQMAECPQDLGPALEIAEVQVRVVGIADRPEHFTLDRLVGPVTEATLLGIEAVDGPHQAEHAGGLEVGGVAAARVRREAPAVRAHEPGVEPHDLGGDVFETTPEAGDLTPFDLDFVAHSGRRQLILQRLALAGTTRRCDHRSRERNPLSSPAVGSI